MGLFDFLFKNKKKNIEDVASQQNAEKVKQETDLPRLIRETSYSKTREEKYGIFEYINFKVAGTFYRQEEIKKAIKLEKEKDGIYFDEKYAGMTNREILEDTFDEPIFEYDGAIFTDCELKIERDNKHDTEAIAVYIHKNKVGYVPKKGYAEGKKYIYGLLEGGLKENQKLNFSASLRGGKYKVNRDDESVATGESDYKLDGNLSIKTEK